MTIDSLNVVFYTAIFVLPGFISLGIIDSLNPSNRTTVPVHFYKCFALSIVNCASFSWIFSMLFKHEFSKEWQIYFVLVIVSIIGAIIVGTIIALLKQKNLIYKFLNKIKIKVKHPTPTAWDYWFSKEKSSFVIVCLRDGTKLAGYYSTNSFASSDFEERDLFIEYGYSLKGNEWGIDKESNGVYIAKDSISYIEFKKGAEENEQ